MLTFHQECGHGSFSSYETLNNIIGWAFHSFLGVPFFSWKMSHKQHHMYHNHMDRDTAHVPPRQEEVSPELKEQRHQESDSEDVPLRALYDLVLHQLLGFQLYFLFFITGGKKSYNQKIEPKWYNVSHLDPWSVVFRPQTWHLILISDIGLALVVLGLWFAAQQLSWGKVMLLYGVPYVWVNHWIGMVTLSCINALSSSH